MFLTKFYFYIKRSTGISGKRLLHYRHALFMMGYQTLLQDNNFVDLCNKLFVAFSWAVTCTGPGRFTVVCAFFLISGAPEGSTDSGFRLAGGSNPCRDP